MLNNRLYIGELVWNRSMWTRHFETHRRLRRLRPQEEWITKAMPDLRIVPPELWERVKARQKERHANSEAIRQALHRNARTGRSPKYLFSGLLECGECGAKFVIADTYRYGCARHLNRGRTVCTNRLRVARQMLEAKLLEGVKHKLFSEEGIALFVQETSRLLKERQGNAEFADAQTRLTQTEQEFSISSLSLSKAARRWPHAPNWSGLKPSASGSVRR